MNETPLDVLRRVCSAGEPVAEIPAEPRCRILSIDAWREPEGGWTWNDVHTTGHTITPREIESFYVMNKAGSYRKLSARLVLGWLRAHGLLSAQSAGRLQVADDGHCIEIQARGTREPLLAIEHEPEHV